MHTLERLTATALVLSLSAGHPIQAATITKAVNQTALNLPASWVGGTVPGSADSARWDGTFTVLSNPNLGDNLTWGQLNVANSGAVNIGNTPPSVLTLNGVGGVGVDMVGGTQNATANCGIALGADQLWQIGSGRTLILGGSVNNGGFSLSLYGNAATFGTAAPLGGTGGVASRLWGTLSFYGANTYSGDTSVDTQGTLLLDFSQTGAPANHILNNSANNSALVFNGNGTVQLKGKAASSFSQRFNGLTLNRGGAVLNGASVGTALSYALGAVTRNNASSVDVALNTLGSGTVTATGVLGPWATVNAGADFATLSGGNLVALNAAVAGEGGWLGGDYTFSTSQTLGGSRSANTLRYYVATVADASIDLGASGSSVLTANGILAGTTGKTLTVKRTGGTGSVAIGAGGELDLGALFGATLAVSAPISGNGNVVKVGPGTVSLSSTASTFTGNLIVNAGTLDFACNNLAGTPVGPWSNTILLQGGAIQNGTHLPSYPQTWAGDFTVNSFVAGVSGGSAVTLAGNRILNSGTGGLTVGSIGDGSNSYGLTVRSNWLRVFGGTSTFDGGLFLPGGAFFGDVGSGLPSSGNIVLSAGGTIGPVTAPVMDLTLGSGAGQVRLLDKGGFRASPSAFVAGSLNGGATLQPNATTGFLPSGNILVLAGNNYHAAVLRNPLQISGNSAATLNIYVLNGAGNVSYDVWTYDAVVPGDITQGAGLGTLSKQGDTAAEANSVLIYGGAGNYGKLDGNQGVFIPTRPAGIPSGIVLGNTAGLTIAPRAGTADGWASGDVDALLAKVNAAGNVSFGIDVAAEPFSYSLANYGTSGSRKFLKVGPGTLTLTGPAGYSGSTTIGMGALAISNPNQVSSALYFAKGAQLDALNASGTLLDLSSKTVTLRALEASGTVNLFGGTGDIKFPAFTAAGGGVYSELRNVGTGEVQFLGFAGHSQSYYCLTGTGDFRIANLANVAAQSPNFIFDNPGGTVTLDGTLTRNTSGTPRIYVHAGNVVFAYATGSEVKLPTGYGPLTAGGGGDVTFANSSAVAVNDTSTGGFNNGAGLYRGQCRIQALSLGSGSTTVNLGAMTSTSVGPMDFNPSANAAITYASSDRMGASGTVMNNKGIMAPWATFQGTTWAVATGASAPYTVSGLVAFDQYNALANNSAHNDTIDFSSAVPTPPANVQVNTIRFANVTSTAQSLNLNGKTLKVAGILMADTGAGDVTIADGTASTSTLAFDVNGFRAGDGLTIWQNNPDATLIIDVPLAGSYPFVKAGLGTVRFTKPSALNQTLNVAKGMIQLTAGNELGTGALLLSDLTGTSGFTTLAGDITIANNSVTGTSQNNGGLRGVRFAGDHNITLTGLWQTPDMATSTGGARLTIDAASGSKVLFAPGTDSNLAPGTLVVGDTNSGRLTVGGTGGATLEFATPVASAASSTDANTLVSVRRPDGVTVFNAGLGVPTLNIDQGVAIVKGTAHAPVDQNKAGVAFASGSATLSLPDTTGLAVGMVVRGNANFPVGAYVIAVDSVAKTVTLNRKATGTAASSANQAVLFQGVGPAGRDKTLVAAQGVLGLGANIPVPATLIGASCGTIGIETDGYAQDLDFATYGSGEMYLGSATTGSITGGTLRPGLHGTHRLGGGGGKLTIGGVNLLTGAASVLIGSSSLFKGTTSEVSLDGDQDFSGNTRVNAGRLILNGKLTGGGALTLGDGDVVLNAEAMHIGDVIFDGTGKIVVGAAGGSAYLLANPANYSVAEAQADIAAGRIVSAVPGKQLFAYSATINGSAYTVVGNLSTGLTLILVR